MRARRVYAGAVLGGALALGAIATAQQTSPAPAPQQNAPQPPAPLPPDPMQPQTVATPSTPQSTEHLRSGQLQQTYEPDQKRGNVNVPDVPLVQPIGGPVATPPPDAAIERTADNKTQPARAFGGGLSPHFLGFLGPYKRPTVPPLFPGNQTRLQSLIRDNKLYITLSDAIALALENNLDIEVQRYNLVLAHTDEVRAAGGGTLRGIDYGIELPPNGVGGPGSPLLNAATTSTNPTTPTVADLTSLNSTQQQQQSLSNLAAGFQYAPGPNIPLFDPQLIGEAGYFRRSDTQTLTSATGTTGTAPGATTPTQTAPLTYTELNVAYLQGFSPGLALEATINNDSQVIYADHSEYNPFHAPSTSVTLTQSLLRGRGSEVNLRFLHIARLDNKISKLLFEQQVLETIYGTSRLYFDLVALGENVLVKQEALKAATKLRDDDQEQEKLGTLAPIDLTRSEALRSSSEFDLIQAQGLYRQQEVIVKTQLLRTASPVFTAQFDEIVPTDKIVVPDTFPQLDVTKLITEGLARRPDLAQADLQVKAGAISAKSSRNAALPQLNAYANVEVRGSSEQAYETLGSPGTGAPTLPQNLALGGLRTSTIYQGGIQLTLPLRNRIAESDAARDLVQLRQSQARSEKLSQEVRQDIEAAVVALETAEAAYRAATKSRDYQQQLLDAERDKLSVGQSTDLLVLQNEAYLAQARSTEVAARSNWKKAQIELDRALGDLLEKNNIELDDAIAGKLR